VIEAEAENSVLKIFLTNVETSHEDPLLQVAQLDASSNVINSSTTNSSSLSEERSIWSCSHNHIHFCQLEHEKLLSTQTSLRFLITISASNTSTVRCELRALLEARILLHLDASPLTVSEPISSFSIEFSASTNASEMVLVTFTAPLSDDYRELETCHFYGQSISDGLLLEPLQM